MAGNDDVIDSLRIEIGINIKGQNKLDSFRKKLESLVPVLEAVNERLREYTGIIETVNTLKMPRVNIPRTNFQAPAVSTPTAAETEVIEPRIGEVAGESGQSTDNVNGLTSSFSRLAAVSSTLKKALDAVKRALKGVKDEADDVGKSTNPIKRFFENISGGLKGLLKTFIRVAKMRMMRAIIRNIVEGLKEGVQNLAQFDSSFNETMSALVSSTAYLKNALGTLAQPLLELVIPVIVKVINFIVEAINKLNAFIALVKGEDTYIAAKKFSIDYAKNLEKASKSAKEIKNSLMGFDEINRLDSPQKETDTGTSPQDMFEYRGVESAFKDTEKVKSTLEKIRKAFEEIGKTFEKIGKKIESVWKTITRVINDIWESIKNVAKKIWDAVYPVFKYVYDWWMVIYRAVGKVLKAIWENIKEIASGIARVASEIWEKIKEILDAIWQIVKAVVGWIWGYVKQFFSWVGTWLSDFYKTYIDPMVQKVKPILDFIWGKIKAFLSDIKNKLMDFHKWIWDKFSDVGERIANFIGGAIKSALNYVFGWIEDKFNGFIGNLNSAISWINSHFHTSINPVTPLKLTRFATGGFPEDGLFMANHGELVGQFANGRTAVANNAQIEAGIEEAAYRGFMRAMQYGGGSGGTTTFIAQLNGKTLFEEVINQNNKATKTYGTSPLTAY